MLVQTGEVVARGLDAQRGRGAAAEQEIAADNRPSSLRSGGRLQLNFSRSADGQRGSESKPAPSLAIGRWARIACGHGSHQQILAAGRKDGVLVQ